MAELRDAGHQPSVSADTGNGIDSVTGVRAMHSGMAYVAGYVARKAPAGDRSCDVPSAYAEDVLKEALWTCLLSTGCLTVPTQAFIDAYDAVSVLGFFGRSSC